MHPICMHAISPYKILLWQLKIGVKDALVTSLSQISYKANPNHRYYYNEILVSQMFCKGDPNGKINFKEENSKLPLQMWDPILHKWDAFQICIQGVQRLSNNLPLVYFAMGLQNINQQLGAAMPIAFQHQKNSKMLTNFINESVTFFKASTFFVGNTWSPASTTTD